MSEWAYKEWNQQTEEEKNDPDGPQLESTDSVVMTAIAPADVVKNHETTHYLLELTNQISKFNVSHRVCHRVSLYIAHLNKRLNAEATSPVKQKKYYPDLFKHLQGIDYSQNVDDPLSIF